MQCVHHTPYWWIGTRRQMTFQPSTLTPKRRLNLLAKEQEVQWSVIMKQKSRKGTRKQMKPDKNLSWHSKEPSNFLDSMSYHDIEPQDKYRPYWWQTICDLFTLRMPKQCFPFSLTLLFVSSLPQKITKYKTDKLMVSNRN